MAAARMSRNRPINTMADRMNTDVIIIGAGASGLFCAITAAKRGRRVTLIERANKPGKKILMSGGGRCNFTNYYIHSDCYLSHNLHFCKSALSRYTQWDFIELVKKHRIAFHEKTLGQLFCDHKSKDILEMLLLECEKFNVHIQLNTNVTSIQKINDYHYHIKTNELDYHCESLVIACGGLSIPTMGASDFGYRIAKQFGLPVWPTRAALVPFTLSEIEKNKLQSLSGIAIPSKVTHAKTSFQEGLLFTHRGISGPAILQISSYWQPGQSITINLLPNYSLFDALKETQKKNPKQSIKSILSDLLPKRLVNTWFSEELLEQFISDVSHNQLQQIAYALQHWSLKPSGTEGYRTAEVTLGGIDCNALSSKTMMANDLPGLYFIGEVIDVTGWLGGYNFQWAWSSGWAAGQVV